MAKHTPGPWEAIGWRVASSKGEASKAVYCTVAECFPDRGGPIVKPTSDNEATANARLIAAAPAMLEALQMVADMLDNFPGFDSRAVPFVDRPCGNIGFEIRAAIRAATGEK